MRANAMQGLLLLTLGLMLGMPLDARAQAGRVLLAVGDVVAVRGTQQVRLSFGASVQSGDTIRLGPSSNAQIRMSDESIISLRENTALRLDEYVYSGQIDGKEKSIFSLIAGGMRTVTGLIGRLHSREKYLVNTPVATIGVRGTHYTLVVCNNDCAPTAPGGGATPNGTYGGVTDGRIGVHNDSGEHVFGAHQFFRVADRQSAPQELLGPPPFLHDRLAARSRTSGQRGKETGETLAKGGINAESRQSEPPPAPLPSVFVVSERRDPSGQLALLPPPSQGGFAAGTYTELGVITSLSHSIVLEMEVSPSEIVDSDVQRFDANGLMRFECGSDCFADRNQATVAERGGVPGVIEWGKWVGGPISAGGWADGLVFGDNQAMHYIVGVPTDPMPRAGTGNFVLLGATTPTFSDGIGGGLGRGSVTSATGSVDFLSGTVNADLALAFSGSSGRSDYALAMRNGSISSYAPNFSGSGTMAFRNGAVNICSSSCYAQFVGGFAGPNASHMGIGYDVYSSGFYVNGVAVMRRQ